MPDGLLSSLIEVVGLLVMLVAAWLFDPLAGVFVLGALLVLVGFVLGDRSSL